MRRIVACVIAGSSGLFLGSTAGWFLMLFALPAIGVSCAGGCDSWMLAATALGGLGGLVSGVLWALEH